MVSIGASTAEFEAAIKQTSTHLKNFQRDTKALEPIMNAVGTAIRVVGTAMIGAFVGGGTAALASGQIIEKYRMSLTTLMGSSQAAGKAVASALALAAKTPFTDDQLLSATVALTKFGQSAQAVLPQVANMAAATNGDVVQAAEAYGAFLQGRVKALQSFGITKAAVLAEGAATEQGIEIANKKGQIVNEDAYNKALLSLMDKRFKAGAELQANSLGGLIKGMKDTGEDILRTIAGFADDGTVRAGSLFDFFKQGITEVLAKVEEWKANGSLQRWATDVGQAIMVFFTNAKIVFNWLVNIALWIAKNWDAITPVIAGVVGAFVAFKAVTIYVDVAAVAVKLFGAAVAGTLGPLGWIMFAVSALSAVVVIATQHWNAFRIALGMATKEASATNIQIAKNALDAYDQVTKANRKTMEGDAIQAQALAAYDKQRAQDRIALSKNVQNQIDSVRGAAMDAQVRDEEAYKAKTVADAVNTGGTITGVVTKTADAVKKASTSAADAIAKTNADLANKNYDLTHTELQNKLHAIDLEAAADLKAGANATAVAQWVANSKAQINKDAAKEKAAADKEAADKAAAAQKDAQDKYLAAVKDYASKQKDAVTTLTQTIVDNYQIRENAAIKQLEDERNARLAAINTQISDLAGQHDKAAQSDKMAGLAANFANATTEEDRAAASKTLMDAVNEEAYQNQLASLQKEQETVADKYNNSDTGMIASIVTFYDQKMAAANVNAEAEELLANTTTIDIIKTLESHLPEFASMGAAAGNAFAADYRAAIASTGILGSTANPVTVAAKAANASNVSAGLQSVSFGGGSGRSLMAHANGGYFTTPHIALIAENGPEAVVPQSQASSFAKQMGGSNDALLRQLALKMDTLTAAVRQVAPGVGNVINGLGRA